MTYRSRDDSTFPSSCDALICNLQHCCCLQSTWLPWPYTLPLILCGNFCHMHCEIYACRLEDSGGIFFYIPSQTNFSFSLQDCLSLSPSLLPFTVLCGLLFLAVIVPTEARMGAWQTGIPGACLVCSAAAEISTATPDISQLCSTKKLFLFIRTIFKKENEFQVKNLCLTIFYTAWDHTTPVVPQSTLSLVSLSKYSASSSKLPRCYHFIVCFTIWSVWYAV